MGKAAALGRVFGGGCRSLHIFLWNHPGDTSEFTKSMLLEATRAFHETIAPPGLEELHILGSLMPEKMLLEICGANPRMVELSINSIFPLSTGVLASVGLACPLLTTVDLSTGGLSEAEAYAMHFPRLETLRFGVRGEGTQSNRYIPAGLNLIEESVARCVQATRCDFDDCVVTPALAECVLRSSLPSRVTYLNLYCSQVTSKTVLAFAASFQNLTSLLLPPTFAGPFDSDAYEYGDPDFYEAIWRARPTITEMDVSYVDGADIEVVCRLFPLKNLTIMHHAFEYGSTTLVDTILASPCRDTLVEVGISCTSASELLRLVTTLKNLKNLIDSDMVEPDEPEPDSEKIFERIDHIMASRGGAFY